MAFMHSVTNVVSTHPIHGLKMNGGCIIGACTFAVICAVVHTFAKEKMLHHGFDVGGDLKMLGYD